MVSELKIVSLTPIMLSGSDPSRFDSVFRLSSLRGLVEWVFRALIAAGAISLNLDEIDVVKKVVPRVFGGNGFSSRIVFKGSFEVLNGNQVRSNSEKKSKNMHPASSATVNKSDIDLSTSASSNSKNMHPASSDFCRLIKYVVEEVFCTLDDRRKLKCKIKFLHPRFRLLWVNLEKKILGAIASDINHKKTYRELLNNLRNISFSWDFHSNNKTSNINSYPPEIKSFINIFNKYLFEFIFNSIGYLKEGTIYVYISSAFVTPYETLALISLVLALLLFGLGKGARRGLGAVKITSIKINSVPEHPKNKYSRGNSMLKNTREIIEDSIKKPTRVVDLINFGVDLARLIITNLKNKGEHFKRRDTKMKFPAFPAFYTGKYSLVIKRVHSTTDVFGMNLDLWKEICRINENLFLRSSELGLYLRDIRNPFQATKETNHYILGLPRTGRITKNKILYEVKIKPFEDGSAKLSIASKNVKNTGFSGEFNRRASPIIVSAFDESTIIVSYFISQDWPPKLKWYSAEKKSINRNIRWKRLHKILLDIAIKLPRFICGGRAITH